MTDEVGVLHTPLSIGSLWWVGGNVLFLATASGPLLGGIPASLVLLNLQPRASIFCMCVGSSERLQRLTQGTAVSGLLWSVCFTLGVWAELLDLIHLELLQGLNGWRGRRGGGGCLCWWWVLGQPLADLCIAEFSWPLRGGKILKSNRQSSVKTKQKQHNRPPDKSSSYQICGYVWRWFFCGKAAGGRGSLRISWWGSSQRGRGRNALWIKTFGFLCLPWTTIKNKSIFM